MLETRRPTLLLVLFCLALWLPGLFTLPPSDRDESRFAQATKQMVETGDFVRIRNGEVARNRKPIGIHWLQAPFAEVARATGLGTANPIWPYRLPSLLGGIVAVCAAFGFGRLLVGREAALLGAGMLAASVVLAVETHMAKTDAALLAATTVAMGLLGRAYLSPEGFRPRHAAGFWLAMGAGILLKGPVTPMIAGLAALTLTVADLYGAGARERGAGWLRRLHAGWGVPLMLGVVLPWFIAIGLATHGRFFAEAVGGDLAGKMRGGDDAHGAPPGLHLLLLPLTLFPASLAVLAALPASWRLRAEPATRFLLAWALPAWVVFEAVPTKLPHYVLPLFPPLCLLAARWVLDPQRQPPPRWLTGLAATLFALAALVLGTGALALPALLAGHVGPVLLLGLPVALAAALAAWLVLRALPDWRRAVLDGLVVAPLLYGSVLGIELPNLRALWIAPEVAAALRAHWPEGRPGDAGFGAVGFAEPSLMFLCGTDTRLFDNAAQGARFLATGPDHVVLVAARDLPAFTAAAAREGVVPHPFAMLGGFNYSRGRRMTLTLFGR